MAATRGPVPKRSTERRRRNAGEAVTKAPSGATGEAEATAVPATHPAANPAWCEIARDWYESLAKSGQSAFYEPSDWQYARIVAELIDRGLTGDRINGQLFSTIDSMMASLLTTEGDRRRVRVELEKPQDQARVNAERQAKVARLADYRAKASG